MPPRIRLSALQSQCSNCSSATTELRSSRSCTRQLSQSARSQTRLRAKFREWLDGPGANFKDPLPGSTNYLSAYGRGGELQRLSKSVEQEDAPKKDESASETDESASSIESNAGIPPERDQDLRPYPLNASFKSERVLSEELRELVYERHLSGHNVVELSAQFKISLERVAAVIRLKKIEKDWAEQGKPLAKAYSKAVLAMLPKTTVDSKKDHESITDIPVLSSTRRQVFHPVSESMRFTRADAAKVFHPNLKSADERMPHQELVLAEKLRMEGRTNYEIRTEVGEYVAKQQQERHDAAERQKGYKDARTKVVAGVRWDFKIEEMNAENVGANGRSGKGVGWRYGIPHEDRKRGQVKIPTQVSA